jgi:hypothetical protein
VAVQEKDEGELQGEILPRLQNFLTDFTSFPTSAARSIGREISYLLEMETRSIARSEIECLYSIL